MKARQLIGSAAYGPEQLKVLFDAFDQAWDAVAAGAGDDPGYIEAARLRLANIVLSLARDGDFNAARLKDTAVRLFSRSAPPTGD